MSSFKITAWLLRLLWYKDANDKLMSKDLSLKGKLSPSARTGFQSEILSSKALLEMSRSITKQGISSCEKSAAKLDFPQP